MSKREIYTCDKKDCEFESGNDLQFMFAKLLMTNPGTDKSYANYDKHLCLKCCEEVFGVQL